MASPSIASLAIASASSVLLSANVDDSLGLERPQQLKGPEEQRLEPLVLHPVLAVDLLDQQLAVREHRDLGEAQRRNVLESPDQGLVLGDVVGLRAQEPATSADDLAVPLDDESGACRTGVSPRASVGSQDRAAHSSPVRTTMSRWQCGQTATSGPARSSLIRSAGSDMRHAEHVSPSSRPTPTPPLLSRAASYSASVAASSDCGKGRALGLEAGGLCLKRSSDRLELLDGGGLLLR